MRKILLLFVIVLLSVHIASAATYMVSDTLDDKDNVTYEIDSDEYDIELIDIGSDAAEFKINGERTGDLEEGDVAYWNTDDDSFYTTATDLDDLPDDADGFAIYVENILSDAVDYQFYGVCEDQYCIEEEGDLPDLEIKTIEDNFSTPYVGTNKFTITMWNSGKGLVILNKIFVDDEECDGTGNEIEFPHALPSGIYVDHEGATFTCEKDGLFDLKLEIDPDDDIEESDEDNNKYYRRDYEVEERDDDYYACEEDSDCDDQDPSTDDRCVDNNCTFTARADCQSGDNVCPTGCTESNDLDCALLDECDDDSDCEDGNILTKDYCGSSEPRTCAHQIITECGDGDDFCPVGCTHADDDDCEELVDECETPLDCDDGKASTTDRCSGTPKQCRHIEIEECAHDDGYCYEDCTFAEDNDCTMLDRCQAPSECDDDNPCTTDTCVGDPKQCEHDVESGCPAGGECVPEGDYSEKRYCDGHQLQEKQERENSCGNDYECLNGACTDGFCKKPGLFRVLLDWFAGLFG